MTDQASAHQRPPADESEETAYLTAKLGTRTRFEVRPQVFIPAVVVIALFVAVGALFPDAATQFFETVQGGIATTSAGSTPSP